MKETPEKFARLEDTQFGQILSTIQRDENGEGPTIRTRLADRHGMELTIVLGPWPDTEKGWEQAQSSFEKVDLQDIANDMAAYVDEMVEKS